MINQLTSQFIASLCIIFTEVQHVEVKIAQQRRKNTVPSPFFLVLKPSTPPSLKSNIYAPCILPPPPLTHRRCSLRLNQLSGQQKARGQDSRGHSIGEGPRAAPGFEPVDRHPGPQLTRGSVPGRPRLWGWEAAGRARPWGPRAEVLGPRRPRELGPRGRHSLTSILSRLSAFQPG